MGERTLILAGIYNIAWGSFVVLWPTALFTWARMEVPRYPQIWQCVGMMVGVYGVGYLIAAGNPARHWPVVLAGLLGKILGPAGFLFEAAQGRLPWRAGWVIVTNDLIWWIPFALILHRCLKRSMEGSRGHKNLGVLPRALGESWNGLDEVIRGFHSGASPTRASGLFDIQRGRGRCARLLSCILRFPPSGQRVPTTLEIRPDSGGETWRRTFQRHTLVSQLSEDGGRIVERFAAGEFRLHVGVCSGGLQVRSERFSLGLGPIRVSLPRWIAPRVDATIKRSNSERLSVSVGLAVPGIGLVLAYQGELQAGME